MPPLFRRRDPDVLLGELSDALGEMGFSNVVGRPVLAGNVGFHAASK